MARFDTGSEVFFDHQEALEEVQRCQREGVRILGMEFFRGGPGSYTPVGGTAWDELVDEPPEATWREARALLADGIPDGGEWVVLTTAKS